MRNVIAIEASNAGGPAGWILKGYIQSEKGEKIPIISDSTWKTSKNATGIQMFSAKILLNKE